MSKAFDLSQAGRGRGITADLGAYRNKIINGDFDIWQRGTTFTLSGYTADRWGVFAPPGTSFTASRAVYSNGTWGLMLGRSATGAGDLQLYQRIENVRTLAGKKVTLTFHALKTGTTGGTSVPIDIKLTQVFGTGGSTSVETVTKRVTAVSSASKFSVTFDLPSISDKAFGDGHNLSLVLFIPSSAGNFSGLYLSRISLVEGDATAEEDPFSPRHIQQELTLCQRYYEVGAVALSAYCEAGNGLFYRQSFQTQKRVTPATTYSVGSTNNVTVFDVREADQVSLLCYSQAAATGQSSVQLGWTADAEL